MNVLVYLGKNKKKYNVVSIATLLAKGLDVEITLLHVLGRGEGQEVGEEILHLAEEQAEGVEVEKLLRWGDPAGVLLSEANQGKYDLIIMQVGKKYKAIPRLTPLDKIVSESIYPSVLIARNSIKSINNILVCTSGGSAKNEVFNTSAELAKAFTAKVTLLHVASGSVPTMYTGLQEIEETLEELLKTETPVAKHLRRGAEIMDAKNIDGELELRRGVPIDEIVREVKLGNYDLMVIGRSRVSKGLKEFILGDIMQQILTQVRIPILVVGEKRIH